MKKLLIAATGSVAIVKLEKLLELFKAKFDVKLIVSDYVFENFPGIEKLNPIVEDKSLLSFPKHIELAKWADQIIVVPATANTIFKFACGMAETPLLSTLIAARQKIIFVPAMNTYMYQSLCDRKIIYQLQKEGHMFIGPTYGKLREGESGLGRMVEPEEIFETIGNFFEPNGKKVIVTYGASKVYIDDVRYISNDSSGTMGRLLINELRLHGYQVVGIDVSKFSNEEVLKNIKKETFDIYIGAAAFADFTIKKIEGKIAKECNEILQLNLVKNIDVISELKKAFPQKYFVGFKYDNNEENAKNKMGKLNLGLMIWNKIGAMGKDEVSGKIISKNHEIAFNEITKIDLAKLIAKEIK